MYLQKSTQYQSTEYVRVAEEGNLCEETVRFMVAGFKLSIPFVIPATLEVTFNGQWLTETLVITLTIS